MKWVRRTEFFRNFVIYIPKIVILIAGNIFVYDESVI